MLYKVILPLLIFATLSLTLITAVKNNSQVEYFENYEASNYELEPKNSSKIDYQKIAKLNASKKAQVDRPRFYAPKAETAVEKDKKVVESIKKEIKKTQDKKKITAQATTSLKSKNRKPSQVPKDDGKKQKKSEKADDKFVVPAEELPPVDQALFNATGINIYNTNTGSSAVKDEVQVSTGGQTIVPSPTGIQTIIPPTPPTLPMGDDSILIPADSLAVLNESYKSTNNALSAGLNERVRAEIEQAISDHVASYENFQILEYKSFFYNLENNPVGLNSFGKDTLILSLPHKGSWEMEIVVKIHYENTVFQTTEDLKFRIKNLSLNFPFKAVHNTSGQVYFYEATDPIYKYDISFQSTSFITNVVFEIFHLFFPNFLDQSIELAANRLQMDVKSLVNKTKVPVQNINSSYTENKPSAFEDIIANVDQKIRDKHLYHGTVHALKLNKSADNTWAEAYAPGGDGIDGDIEKVLSLDNSAKLSGKYLASQAYKYQLNQNVDNLNAVKQALSGIDKLFKIHDYTGLLARSITPLNSPLGQQLIAQNLNVGSQLIVGSLDGEQWLAYQGEKGISRDQYSAVLFGLATTYDLVNDSAVKNQCKFLVGKILHYLENNFWIFEYDRQKLTTAFSENSPSIWQGANHFKLMYLLIGAHMDPAHWGEKLAQVNKLVDSAWLATFFQIVDPYNGYEKFDIEYTDLYTYFRLETNMERRQKMKEVVRILDFYLGHHRNVYFDTIYASIFPEKLSNKLNNMQVGLYKYVKRAHRLIRHADINMSEIISVNTVLPTGENVTMAKEALSTEHRDLSSEFVWEKSAHHIEENDPTDASIESVGIDLTLPHFMAKFHQFY